MRGLHSDELAFLNQNQCPDCHSSKFLKGPQAGMCTNIKCGICGSEFNIGGFGGQRLTPDPTTANTARA